MYSQRLLDHYRYPRNKGALESSDAPHAPGQVLAAEEYNPLCGDRVRLEMRLEAERIAEVGWTGRGCALCMGAASILAEMVEGHTLDELVAVGQQEFLAELGSDIRPARLKCALLPWMAFRHAAFGEQEWPL
jgi:nitrogen fixation NifU-like protein